MDGPLLIVCKGRGDFMIVRNIHKKPQAGTQTRRQIYQTLLMKLQGAKQSTKS